jgi:hypothetical protein
MYVTGPCKEIQDTLLEVVFVWDKPHLSEINNVSEEYTDLCERGQNGPVQHHGGSPRFRDQHWGHLPPAVRLLPPANVTQLRKV